MEPPPPEETVVPSPAPEPEPDAASHPPATEPRPAEVAAAVVLIAVFGAVCGMHVLGLMAGHAQFLATRQIEGLLPDQSLATCGVPVQVAPMAALLNKLALIGHWPLLLLATLLAGAVASYGQVRLMNPGLLARLRDGRLQPWRLVVALLLTVVTLTVALWPLPPALAASLLPFARAAVAGGLVWMFWHARGWLHDLEDPPSDWAVLAQLPCGALVGIAAHGLLRHQLTGFDTQVVSNWLEAGHWSPVAWREIALFAVVGRVWGGLVVGSLAVGLGLAGVGFFRRVALVLMPVVLLALLTAGGLYRMRAVWAVRYGFGEPLMVHLGLPRGPLPPPPQRLVVAMSAPDGSLPVWPVAGRGVLGLPLAPGIDRACTELLQRTNQATCQATQALMQVHDSATDRWNLPALLEVQMLQMRSPATSPMFEAVHLETLNRCAWGPLADQCAAALADPARFDYPNPRALAQVAVTCWRWSRLEGLRSRLEQRNAELLRKLKETAPPHHDGVIAGRLTWQGKPLARVQVGLLPAEASAAWVGQPELTPWLQRLVCAADVTGADGAFRLVNLFEGRYLLVVAMGVAEMPGKGPWEARGQTDPVTLEGKARRRNLGVIELRPFQQKRNVVPVGVTGT